MERASPLFKENLGGESIEFGGACVPVSFLQFEPEFRQRIGSTGLALLVVP
jgi:hypothetical protein